MDLARAFVRGSEAGMVHVNNGTVSEGHMPFGGVQQSGMGAYGIGATNKEFFTSLKVVYHQHGEGSRPPVRRLLADGDPACATSAFPSSPPRRPPGGWLSSTLSSRRQTLATT